MCEKSKLFIAWIHLIDFCFWFSFSNAKLHDDSFRLGVDCNSYTFYISARTFYGPTVTFLGLAAPFSYWEQSFAGLPATFDGSTMTFPGLDATFRTRRQLFLGQLGADLCWNHGLFSWAHNDFLRLGAAFFLANVKFFWHGGNFFRLVLGPQRLFLAGRRLFMDQQAVFEASRRLFRFGLFFLGHRRLFLTWILLFLSTRRFFLDRQRRSAEFVWLNGNFFQLGDDIFRPLFMSQRRSFRYGPTFS